MEIDDLQSHTKIRIFNELCDDDDDVEVIEVDNWVSSLPRPKISAEIWSE